MEYTKGEWGLSKALGDHYGRFKGDYAVRAGEDIVAICPNEGKEFNAQANARLIAASPLMYEKLIKIINWLEKMAEEYESKAKTERFPTLKDAYIADAKNCRATIADLRIATNKAEGK